MAEGSCVPNASDKAFLAAMLIAGTHAMENPDATLAMSRIG